MKLGYPSPSVSTMTSVFVPGCRHPDSNPSGSKSPSVSGSVGSVLPNTFQTCTSRLVHDSGLLGGRSSGVPSSESEMPSSSSSVSCSSGGTCSRRITRVLRTATADFSLVFAALVFTNAWYVKYPAVMFVQRKSQFWRFPETVGFPSMRYTVTPLVDGPG